MYCTHNRVINQVRPVFIYIAQYHKSQFVSRGFTVYRDKQNTRRERYDDMPSRSKRLEGTDSYTICNCMLCITDSDSTYIHTCIVHVYMLVIVCVCVCVRCGCWYVCRTKQNKNKKEKNWMKLGVYIIHTQKSSFCLLFNYKCIISKFT